MQSVKGSFACNAFEKYVFLLKYFKYVHILSQA